MIDGKTLYIAHQDGEPLGRGKLPPYWENLPGVERDHWERTAASLVPQSKTLQRFVRFTEIISSSGNPDEDFWYLGGPMTGIPQFNFPAFQRIAGNLRAAGYNLVTPHELDDPETEAAALASRDGAPGSGSSHGEGWSDFLARDVVIVSLPTCVGGIFMEDWHHSSGANLESYVLDRLGKQVCEYHENDEELWLVDIDRNERLRELHLIDEERLRIAEAGGHEEAQELRQKLARRAGVIDFDPYSAKEPA